ncbi:MAG: DNA polymerase III subunit delta [Acidobacteria bacterium]|nr:MAG: DNA polymerase III subunit delta [Acidobacteriota bacterium]
MPAATPADVRAAVARRAPDPVYLLVGDDEAETAALAAEISSLVEDEMRAFNLERLYAGDKGVTPASIAESARQFPMMSDRRVVVVLRGERLLKPKRRGRGGSDEEGEDDSTEPASELDALTEYILRPEPSTTLAIVATDVDKTRRVWKAALQKNATIVQCWGLKTAKDERVDLRQAARMAEQIVRQAVAQAGQQIEPAALRLIAGRAGADIARLRGDLGRLLLYATGRPKITLADVQEVVSGETAQDDWAVTNAIQQRNAKEALRQLALSLEAGGVPYMILGQLAWFVRERLSGADPRRVPRAVEALFRTDQEMKSSGGDPRVLLERLVVELCG